MAPDLFCVLGASTTNFPQGFPQVFISHSYAFVFLCKSYSLHIHSLAYYLNIRTFCDNIAFLKYKLCPNYVFSQRH